MRFLVLVHFVLICLLLLLLFLLLKRVLFFVSLLDSVCYCFIFLFIYFLYFKCKQILQFLQIKMTF